MLYKLPNSFTVLLLLYYSSCCVIALLVVGMECLLLAACACRGKEKSYDAIIPENQTNERITI